jgi:hypothetical protein
VKGPSHQLTLKKQLLLLRLESYRLEIEADVHALKNPVRNIAIGGGFLKILRSHPIILTIASALVARVPRLGLLIKLAGAGLAVWQGVQMVREWKR